MVWNEPVLKPLDGLVAVQPEVDVVPLAHCQSSDVSNVVLPLAPVRVTAILVDG